MDTQSTRAALWPHAVTARTVFVLVASLQLVFIGQFGISWDEPLHRLWGDMFAAFLRTGDERIIEQMPGLGMYYGPVYYLANNVVTTLVNRLTPIGTVAAGHVLNTLTFALACSFTWTLAKRMFSAITANLAVLALLAIPPLLAHAQYNPKDIPLMCACAGAVLAFQRFLKARTTTSAAVAGIACGAALAIKLSAVLLFPVLLATYAVTLWTGRSSVAWAREWRLAAICAACCVVAVFVLWPTLLAEPNLLPRAFRAFQSRFFSHNVLFLGREYPGDALPWYYVPFWLVAWTPVPVLGAFVVGCGVSVARIARGVRVREHVLLVGWVAFPLALTALPGVVRYDSYRQFLFTLPAVAIVAARGLEAIAAQPRALGTFRQRLAGLMGVCLLWVLVDVATVFPYEGAYVNPVVRHAVGQPLERRLELEH